MIFNSVKKYLANLLLIVFLATFCFGEAFGDQTLWYLQPSDAWEKGLPLGNGRLGMVVNGTADEHIVFNENSMWSGYYEEKQDSHRPNAFAGLQELRALIAADAPQKQILSVVRDKFASDLGYYKPNFGHYQSFFDAHIDFDHELEKMSDYRRSLDLETAVSDVTSRIKVS
ncbi:MAG: glycoside hydrolase family 95 protein, partial [Kiritimatiellaceae bacterium]|nr:glycoside hydrolase family 95 protein [Kiritimatiellaceae bacterium]